MEFAIDFQADANNTFTGRPLEHYLRVFFLTEYGAIVNGEPVFTIERHEAKRCEKGDFETTEEEEKTLRIAGEAWCKPDLYKYKMKG